MASHVRQNKRQVDPIIKMEHMPANHKQYLSYNSESFMEWAGNIGENTAKVMKSFLSEGRSPEQGYKSCRNLIRQHEKYGTKNLEEACLRLLSYSGTPNIRSLIQLLKSPVGYGEQTVTSTSVKHSSRGITRGASQFKRGG